MLIDLPFAKTSGWSLSSHRRRVGMDATQGDALQYCDPYGWRCPRAPPCSTTDYDATFDAREFQASNGCKAHHHHADSTHAKGSWFQWAEEQRRLSRLSVGGEEDVIMYGLVLMMWMERLQSSKAIFCLSFGRSKSNESMLFPFTLHSLLTHAHARNSHTRMNTPKKPTNNNK
jgi:hypothetical protein